MQFNLKLQMISKQHKKGVGFNQRPWRICRWFSHRCDKPYASGLSDCKPSCSCAKIRLLLKDKRKIVTDSHTYDLSSDQFKGGCHTDGIQYIREFTYDGTICFTYEAGDITIKNTSHWHREKISLPWHMRFKTKAKRLSFDHASYELP